MQLPTGLTRPLRRLIVTACVSALAIVGVVGPATAAPAPHLCKMDSTRGSVPESFPIEACVDDTGIWLRDDLNVPVDLVVNGDATDPVAVTPDVSIGALLTRDKMGRPTLMLPGDIVHVPVGTGTVFLAVANSNANTYYVVARALGAEDVPTTLAELRASLAGFRPELASTEPARDVARFLLLTPPLPWPARPGYGLIAAAGVGLLPVWARRELALPAVPALDPVLRAGGTAITATIRWALDPLDPVRTAAPAA